MTAVASTGRMKMKVDGAQGPLTSWRKPMWGLFLVALVAGSIGVTARMLSGHLDTGYGSYVPWGLWIAIYFHGMGIAGGAFAVSSIGYLFRFPGFRTRRSLRIGIVLSAAAIVAALLAVGFDLGRMERGWRILVSPSFTSMMAFNAWTYIALLVVCAVAWFLSYRPDRGWLRPVLILGALLSLMVPSQSGAFLAVVEAKSYWNTALLPILMLVSGLTSGAAALLLVRGVIAGTRSSETWREAAEALTVLRRIVLIGISVYFLMEFAEISTGFWTRSAESESLSLVLTGPYWWVFWIVQVAVGGVIAIMLLLSRRPISWVIGGAVVAVAFLSSRLNVLIPGQAEEQLEGLQASFFHPRLSYIYQATLMEYLVALFVLAVGIAVFYVGLRFSTAVETRFSRKELLDG